MEAPWVDYPGASVQSIDCSGGVRFQVLHLQPGEDSFDKIPAAELVALGTTAEMFQDIKHDFVAAAVGSVQRQLGNSLSSFHCHPPCPIPVHVSSQSSAAVNTSILCIQRPHFLKSGKKSPSP